MFIFMTGADITDKFHSCITSYDYDAPLSEAGDLTEKYFVLRNITKKVRICIIFLHHSRVCTLWEAINH